MPRAVDTPAYTRPPLPSSQTPLSRPAQTLFDVVGLCEKPVSLSVKVLGLILLSSLMAKLLEIDQDCWLFSKDSKFQKEVQRSAWYLELKSRDGQASVDSPSSLREKMLAFAAIRLNDFEKDTEEGLLQVARYEILRSIRTFDLDERRNPLPTRLYSRVKLGVVGSEDFPLRLHLARAVGWYFRRYSDPTVSLFYLTKISFSVKNVPNRPLRPFIGLISEVQSLLQVGEIMENENISNTLDAARFAWEMEDETVQAYQVGRTKSLKKHWDYWCGHRAAGCIGDCDGSFCTARYGPVIYPASILHRIAEKKIPNDSE